MIKEHSPTNKNLNLPQFYEKLLIIQNKDGSMNNQIVNQSQRVNNWEKLPEEIKAKVLTHLFFENDPVKGIINVARLRSISKSMNATVTKLTVDIIAKKKISLSNLILNSVEKIKTFIKAYDNQLTYLDLRYLDLTHEDVKEIITLTPKIKNLNLMANERIGGDGTKAMILEILRSKNCSNLTSLALGNYCIGGATSNRQLYNGFMCVFVHFGHSCKPTRAGTDPT